MSQIKKKHDEAKKLVLEKTDDLEKIKKEIEMLTVQENQAEGLFSKSNPSSKIWRMRIRTPAITHIMICI